MQDKDFDKLMEKIVNEEIVPNDLLIKKVKQQKTKRSLLIISFIFSIILTLIPIFVTAYFAIESDLKITSMFFLFFGISFIFNFFTVLTLVFIKKISVFFINFEKLLSTK